MLFDSFEAYDVQETRRVSREEGKAEGKAEEILDFLQEYGPVPEELEDEIMHTTDLSLLRSWLKLSARVESIEEFCEKAGI